MADSEQVALITQGVDKWNAWRADNPSVPVDLSGADLQKLSLKRINLAHSTLEDANLSACDLEGANLGGARLRRANFSHARLRGAHLGNAKARSAIFAFSALDHANLLFADFRGADLRAASLKHASLEDINLTKADLSGARLDNAILAGADCSNATFAGASLKGSNLSTAIFRECNMSGVQYDRKILWSTVRKAGLHPGRIWKKRHDLLLDTTMRCKGVDIAWCHGSQHFKRFIQDQDYLEESMEGRGKYVCLLWWLSSDCGRSIARWTLWCLAIAILFAWVFCLLGSHHVNSQYLPFNFQTMFYFSLTTLTTLGAEGIFPVTSMAAAIVGIEVILGYVMLGGLIAFFASRIARRSG